MASVIINVDGNKFNEGGISKSLRGTANKVNSLGRGGTLSTQKNVAENNSYLIDLEMS